MSGRLPIKGETSLGKIVDAVRDLFAGRSNAMGDFTLDANQSTTVVVAINCGPQSRPFLIPRTANAAAALATTYIAGADVTEGQFIVHHANNAQTDRRFGYGLIG